MKIAYYYNENWEKDYISEKFQESGQEIDFFERIIDSQSSGGDHDILSVFVNSEIDGDIIQKFPNLKLIATRSTGYDHIDLKTTSEKGISVANVPTYGENTVAEFAFALLLTLSRRIYEAYDRIARTGSFSQAELRGFDLKGKTMGVVGTGHIGMNVISIALGFGMKVIAFDIKENKETSAAMGFSYVSFDELLAQSDVISLHAPYNEHTHHLINKENIEKIKKGCYLINTARGGLVESEALVMALEKGIIAGAGLDVLEEEGYMSDELKLLHQDHPKLDDLKNLLANHYFIDHPRVIVTPHVAFNTIEAIKRILDATVENIKNFIAGKPSNIITLL